MKETLQNKELPFEGLKIYYSDSILGGKGSEPEFPKKLVNFMKEGGADVLSEHVAGATIQESDEILAAKLGFSIETLKAIKNPCFIRKLDMDWIHEATHVVALINIYSHGVGMELQEAIRKKRLGYNETPILCLIREDLYSTISKMVSGVGKEENKYYFVKPYKNFEDAKEIIKDFLINNRPIDLIPLVAEKRIVDYEY